MKYLIQFTDPKNNVKCWAGMHDDAYGFAPTTRTAIRFDTAEEADRVMRAAYGKSFAAAGSIVPDPDSKPGK
jgi:hypothetical protein